MSSSSYISVPKSEPDDDSSVGTEDLRAVTHGAKVRRRTNIFRILLLIFLCLGTGFTTGYITQGAIIKSAQSLYEKFHTLGTTVSVPLVESGGKSMGAKKFGSRPCDKPPVRREWRSLSRDEKQNYIDAVNCLATTPSGFRDNVTMYDDFAWVHNEKSHATHGSASFLPWHRHFIHIYELSLRGHCNYQGRLPYWDWSLDWEDLPSSPIWSPTLGFGGDGDPATQETVGYGRCVTDGPFSHLKPLTYASHDNPHCLSRGFSNFSGWDARPEALENILNQNQYEKFFLAVENGPHNVVPQGVRGDFYSFTAPYDPVFFLHHAQLDRLWWQWQQRGLPRRLTEYHGRAWMDSDVGATVQDPLTLMGLASDIQVEDVMSTEAGYLCYRY